MQGQELLAGLPEGDIAVCEPLARSPADLGLASSIMAGPVKRQVKGWQLSPRSAGKQRLSDYKVVIWATDSVAPVAEEVSARALEVGAQLKVSGATVSYTAPHKFDVVAAHENYQTLLNAAMTSGMDLKEVARMEGRAYSLEINDRGRGALITRAAVLSHR